MGWELINRNKLLMVNWLAFTNSIQINKNKRNKTK
jgi:hypothetical protein